MNRNNRMRQHRRPSSPHTPGHGDDDLGGRSYKAVAASRDKYLAMARDALSSGDRVLSEYYLQHADHFFRLMKLAEPQQPQHGHPQQQHRHQRPHQDGVPFDGQNVIPAPMSPQETGVPEEPMASTPPESHANGNGQAAGNGSTNTISSNMPAFLREPLPPLTGTEGLPPEND